jgi:hypothetical protein
MRSSRYAVLLVCVAWPAGLALSQNGPPPVAPTAPPQPTAPQPTVPTPAPPTQPAAPIDAWGGMNAGGLAPPPPLGSTAPPQPPPAEDPLATPSDDKEEDSGRGLSWFWIEAQGGFEHLGLKTFDVDEQNLSVGLVPTEASGGVLSAGLGAQIVFLTLGVRARMAFFDAWQVGRVGGEVGFKILLGIFEPRFDLGAGYAALGNFDGVVAESVSIRGFYARAGAGLDLYPVEVLALGVHASFDFMGLTRPGLDPAQIQAIQEDPDIGDLPAAREQALAVEGSAFGAALAIQGTVGLHF